MRVLSDDGASRYGARPWTVLLKLFCSASPEKPWAMVSPTADAVQTLWWQTGHPRSAAWCPPPPYPPINVESCPAPPPSPLSWGEGEGPPSLRIGALRRLPQSARVSSWSDLTQSRRELYVLQTLVSNPWLNPRNSSSNSLNLGFNQASNLNS